MWIRYRSKVPRGVGAAPSEIGRRRGGDTFHFLLVKTNVAAMFTENGGRCFELVSGVDVASDK